MCLHFTPLTWMVICYKCWKWKILELKNNSKIGIVLPITIIMALIKCQTGHSYHSFVQCSLLKNEIITLPNWPNQVELCDCDCYTVRHSRQQCWCHLWFWSKSHLWFWIAAQFVAIQPTRTCSLSWHDRHDDAWFGSSQCFHRTRRSNLVPVLPN